MRIFQSCWLVPSGCLTTFTAIQVTLSKQSPYVKSAHRVSGLMLANHTSIRLLIEKCLRSFRKLFPKFYVDHYKGFSLFNDTAGNLVLDEFEDAADVVQDLCDEYKACEDDGYVKGIDNAAVPPVQEFADQRLRPRTTEGLR
jgi:tubulin gamma